MTPLNKLPKWRQKLVADHLCMIGTTVQGWLAHCNIYGDWTGEAFFGILRAAESFKKSRGVKFKTYAMNGIKYKIRNEIAKEKRKFHDHVTLDFTEGEHKDTMDEFDAYIKNLPPNHAAILTLHYRYRYSYREIGELLKMTKQNVGRIMKMSLKKIRNSLINKENYYD